MDFDWAKIRVISQHATVMVGLDRLRFNEAVNAGNYPCAPEGQRGKPRMFVGEESLQGLYYFARQLEDKVEQARAGMNACSLIRFFNECRAVGRPFDGNTVVLVRGEAHGQSIFVDGRQFNPDLNRPDAATGRGAEFYRGMGRNLLSTMIDIGNMREIIREKFGTMMEEQRHTLGAASADDEE